MRHKLSYLALILVGVTAAALAQQPPVEKNTKPAEKKGDKHSKAAERSADKPGKSGDKSAEVDMKMGVSTEAEKHLDQAISKIEALTQFRTDLRQKTEILGYTFTADGQYAVAPGFRMLYELKVQLTDTTGIIKEVCDGKTHWRNQKIFDEQQLLRTDLQKLRTIVDKPEFSKEIRDTLIRSFGFSGMVPLMRGLRDSQKFDTFDEDTLDEIPVYVLHGQWLEKVISQSSFRGQQLSLANLPPFMPSKVTAWIGRETGWLHKVEMESAKKVQGSTTKITLEFLNPQIGVQFPDSFFVFEPPAGVHMDDQTEGMYQRLNLLLQQQSSSTRSSTGSTGAGDEKAKPKSSSIELGPTEKPATGLKP